MATSGTDSLISPRMSEKRGRCRRWYLRCIPSLRTRYIMAAKIVRPVATLPMRMVQRGPHAEPIQPISGEPSGVPPIKTAM